MKRPRKKRRKGTRIRWREAAMAHIGRRRAVGKCLLCNQSSVRRDMCAKHVAQDDGRRRAMRDAKRGGPPLRRLACSNCREVGHYVTTCPKERAIERISINEFAASRPGAQHPTGD